MNKAYIRKVANRLNTLKHEEHYNQGVICTKNSCGTAACIAGHAVVMNPAYQARILHPTATTIHITRKKDKIPLKDLANFIYDRYEMPPATATRIKAAYVDTLEEARKLFGLTQAQADVLFAGDPVSVWPQPYSAMWEAAMNGSYKERYSRIAARFLYDIADEKIKL